MFSAELYPLIFRNVVLVIVLLKCISLLTNSGYNDNITDKIKALLLCFVIIVFSGSRPIDGSIGDTRMYAHSYNLCVNGVNMDGNSGEWLWSWIITICVDVGLSVNAWFTVIAFLYVGLLFLVSIRITRNSSYLIILFFISAFVFYSGAVNGLRIGLATSIFTLALTYISSCHLTRKIFAILLFIAAFFTHKSIVLPVFCLFCSIFFFKNIKYPVVFWFFSIVLLLLFGNFCASVLDSLGLFSFDERMENYLIGNRDGVTDYDKGGFRWDFLLFSSTPIVFGWYITVKRKITDKFYIVILNTYILANAFWILVMYAKFSNRFASLSWFLFPLLFAYPLVNFKLWKNQNEKIALILFFYMFFTYFMWLIGK